MKILIVCSATNRQIAPFIKEQAASMEASGETVSFFTIRKKGASGYLSALPALRAAIKAFKPDIVHAHYGLSGLLANLQRTIPVVTTFHGSDIHDPSVRRWSKWAMRFSRHSIFVSAKTVALSGISRNFTLLPCGVNTQLFAPIDKQIARKQLGWGNNEKYILFAGAKENAVKNYPLASQATTQIKDVHLIELKGYNRDEVNLLMNAADVALLTSFTEGSPQFIKEAMACNCPIVSTDVGDVKELTTGIPGCYITSYDPHAVESALREAFRFVALHGRTESRSRITERELSIEQIAKRLTEIYKQNIPYDQQTD